MYITGSASLMCLQNSPTLICDVFTVIRHLTNGSGTVTASKRRCNGWKQQLWTLSYKLLASAS